MVEHPNESQPTPGLHTDGTPFSDESENMTRVKSRTQLASRVANDHDRDQIF